MTDHNEAMRLAEWLKARQSHLGSSRESCWDGEQRCWDNYDQAAALLRKQAERIAELEARVHTCGPTCSKAGCINRRIAAERDTLRAEVERMHEAIAAFCDLNSWGADAWKNQPHIKALFDIDTARKAAP